MVQDTIAKVRRDTDANFAEIRKTLDAFGSDIEEMKRNITSIISRSDLPEALVEEPPPPPPAPANTSLPTISTAREAVQCILTSVGVWSGSPTNFYYQWRLDGADLASATSSAYTPPSGDAGHSLTCAVTAINAFGSTTAVSAAATVAAAIPPDPPVNTVLPTIGSATEGVSCSVTNGTWANSPTSYSYQWRLDGLPISSATASSYTPVTGDVGHLLSCVVTATNSFGSGSAASAPATVIAAAVVGSDWSFNFSGGATGWTQVAFPAPGYAYTPTTVVTGVFSGAARVVAASGKDYPTIWIQVPGLTAGQQYTATIAYANRGAPFIVNALSDPTVGSKTNLNWLRQDTGSSGTVNLTFTAAGTNTYLRLQVFAEGGGGEAVDFSTIDVVPSAVSSLMSTGWWRSAPQPIVLLAEFLAEHTQATTGNPRGWLPDQVGNPFNAASFRSILLARADQVGAAAVAAGATGLILWDFPVGQEFGHVTTYVGAPDEMSVWAPELLQTVGRVAIADEYITRLKSYGLRVGCTLRPQHVPSGTTFPTVPAAGIGSFDPFIKTDATFPHRAWVYWEGDGVDFFPGWYDWSLGGHGFQGPGQVPIRTSADFAAAQQRIIDRIAYGKTRWGMTLYYIDSTTWEYGAALEANTFWAPIQAAHPDVLLMPENDDLGYGNYTVPYGEYRWGDTGLGLNGTDPNAMFAVNFSSMPAGYWIEPYITYMKDQYKAKRLIFIRHWGEADQQAHIDEIVAG